MDDDNVGSRVMNMLISEQLAIYLQGLLNGQGTRRLFEKNNRDESSRPKRMRIKFKGTLSCLKYNIL